MRVIGGVPQAGHWRFDYQPGPVIREIINSGCIPDQVAHQFFPTPATIAERVLEMADIAGEHRVLEPSAGMGSIADLVPKEQLRCVEIAPLHCAVLRAKGHAVECADFLQWSAARALEGAGHAFERIVMNPPYSEGRWRMHLEAAAALLCPGGILSAVLPASAQSPGCTLPLIGGALEWSEVFRDQFPGASVDVVVLKFTKACARASAASAAAGDL